MSHTSDFFLAYSSRVNIWDQALYLTISILLTVTQVELPTEQYPTMLSDRNSLDTSLLEVLISSKHECVFFRDLSDPALHIVFDAWKLVGFNECRLDAAYCLE